MGGIYWLASYPKSGNTWLRVLLTNLQNAGDAPADINTLDTPIASSRGWLDTVLGFDTGDLDFDEIDRLRPAVYGWQPKRDIVRFHKVHDAYKVSDGVAMFGGGTTLGAVYVVRNPLDVAISYAAHTGRSVDRAITYMANPEFAHNAHSDRLATQVRQIYLDWSSHVRSWLDAPDLSVEVLRYEDMHVEPEATLSRVAQFLQLADDPMRVAQAVQNSSFNRLREQESAKGFVERPPGMPAFFREGRTGGWRNTLNDVQIARIIDDHGTMMRRLGYLDEYDNPI